METRHLRYFVALAEELHFRKAAARLCISQPPLSSAIMQMEEDLGVRLFDRDTKSVALTAAGSALYPEAQRTLAQLDQACTVARRTGSGSLGQLRLGCTGGMLLRGVPELLAAYEQLVPDMEISLRESGSAAQAAAIEHRQLDGGFLHASMLPESLDFMTVQREPFVLCVPAIHPMAKKRKVSLADFSRERWVLFARHTSPSYFDSVISLCTEAGFSPHVRHEVTHWMSAVLLVSRGAGVAVVPKAFAKSGVPDVRYLSIDENSSQSLAYFAWRKNSKDPALAAFVKHLTHWTKRAKPI